MSTLAKISFDLETECKNILQYWLRYSVDQKQGGFIGSIDNHNNINLNADKGLVLNARILWTFATAYHKYGISEYKSMAERAYEALTEQFYDEANSGYFWAISHDHIPTNTRKQIYGQAFVLYAYSAYAQNVSGPNVLSKALEIYALIEEHAKDNIHGGYIEALDAEWNVLEDQRLSPKDLNTPKSLNTHLHIMEAYVQLYKVWANDQLKYRIETLIDLFLYKFIDETGHLHMFFTDDWQVIPSPWSYGHDIETSWLLLEAAEAVHYKVDDVKSVSIKMAEIIARLIEGKKGLPYESHINEKHWWVQAEAMVGLVNAYQISGEKAFLSKMADVWNYICTDIIDHEHGEWFWGRTQTGHVMADEDKVGFWKCPYHNVRACIEVSERLNVGD